MKKTKIELTIKDYKKLKKLAEKEIKEWVKFLIELNNIYEKRNIK